MRKRRLAILALILVSTTPAAAAELVVVEAHGIDLMPGQVLDDQKTLTLKEGQSVTLLAASGNMLKLHGPYERAPAAGGSDDPGLLQGVGVLLAERDARTSEVGIIRADVPRVVLPDPWLIDAEHDGNSCVREGQPIVLWRPNPSRQSTVSVMPVDRSWKLALTWPAGADQLTLPDLVQVHQRTGYLIDLDGTRSAVTLNGIPAVVSSDQMRLGWMREKSCDPQAQALLRTLQ